MNYRRATEQDTDNVAQLLVENFDISSAKEGRETFLKEREKDVFIIAEENGKLRGLISWDMHGLPKHQLVRIERIGILSGPNRDEIAENLLSAAIQDADKCFKKQDLKLRKMYTMVHSSNKKLVNFFKKMGFVEEAVLKDHYHKRVDEIVLSIFFE